MYTALIPICECSLQLPCHFTLMYHRNKAVADGAVAFYLHRFVITRVARTTLGVHMRPLYGAKDIEDQHRNNKSFMGEEKLGVASLQDEVDPYQGQCTKTPPELQVLQQADIDSNSVLEARTDDLVILHREGEMLRWSATPASDVIRVVEKLDTEILKCATHLATQLPTLHSQRDTASGTGRSSNHLNSSIASTAPYSGPQRKLVVGIDVGTTFSGVSYCILDPGVVPLVQGVNRCVLFLCTHMCSTPSDATALVTQHSQESAEMRKYRRSFTMTPMVRFELWAQRLCWRTTQS